MRKKFVIILLCSLLSIYITGCNKQEGKNDGKPIVYASFYPVYDLINQVAGDTIDLRSFMDVDKDPHLWEPTPKDMRELKNAELLVINGANLEKWIDQVRENFPELEVLVLSDSVELITYKGAAAIGDFQYMCSFNADEQKLKIDFGHTHEDIMRVTFIKRDSKNVDELIKTGKNAMESKGSIVKQKSEIDIEEGVVYAIEMGHESGEVTLNFPSDGEWVFVSDRISEKILPYDLTYTNGDKVDTEVLLEGSTSGLDKITYDPHSWMSPINAKRYLNSINEELIKKFPENEKLYKKNKLKAVDALTDLEFEFKEKFDDVKIKNFVVTHYAYAYLERDFKLTQFPLQGLVSTESPSLKTIKKAVDYCSFHGINTIFYEENMNSKEAISLAEEIGGKAVALNSMEYQKTKIIDDEINYTSILRENLEKIYESLRK